MTVPGPHCVLPDDDEAVYDSEHDEDVRDNVESGRASAVCVLMMVRTDE